MNETKTQLPTVSIVMPTYNRAYLLPQTLETILSQDYTDFELVIADDGSTDDTAEVLQPILERDERVRYVPLPKNGGIGYARQMGLEAAKSQRYIALADSDDHWRPGKLSRQMALMAKYPQIDILFTDFANHDLLQNSVTDGFAQQAKGMKIVQRKALEPDVWQIESGLEQGLLRADFIGAPTVIVRHSLFDQTGGYNTNLTTTVDHEFFWRAAVKGGTFAYIDDQLLDRYVDTKSVTAQGVRSSEELRDTYPYFHQLADETAQPHLHTYIQAAEQRLTRLILLSHGRSRRYGQIFNTYFKSWRYGFSFKVLAAFVMALGGPAIINNVMERRRQKLQQATNQ